MTHAMGAARHAVITGTGSYVPERVLTNADLAARLGVEIEPFVSETLGIRERHVCADDESTADLAEHAARRAMDDAGVDPESIDLLIVATDTPEFISPATSSVVQGRLGTTNAGTFDINAGCAGYVTALDVASKYIRADDRYERVLVVGAYAMSKYLDYGDKKTATIFADGAGATVIERRAAPGVLASELFADGRLVALWLWTQVNLSTIRTVMSALDVPMSRAHTIIGKWGYTGAACLPMALDDAARTGRLRDGDLVMLTGSGAGLAMGCVAVKWRSGAARQ